MTVSSAKRRAKRKGLGAFSVLVLPFPLRRVVDAGRQSVVQWRPESKDPARTMTLTTAAQTLTWTFVDDDWHEGNVAIVGPRTHAFWLGSSVFDGARWFEGVAPDLDLHAARVNASAISMGMRPTHTPGRDRRPDP